ncbi:MAG: AraC family transcriptional regulator [Lachnospiraceae bacterium]|nr:AraC family transcriptional regulator [Lachnospiraceae bacterium]
MTLKELCRQISCLDPHMLPEDDPIGLRIMCPEYSLHFEEKKTYPLSKEAHLFALCWSISREHRLFATIKPSEPSFSYSCSFHPGDRTQLHTHEYLELAYIVSGHFRQCILGKNIVFEEGDLCLIDKNCLHQDYLEAEPATILFLGISNEIFEEIMNSHVAAGRIQTFLQSALLKQKNLLQYLHFKPAAASKAPLEDCLTSLLKELILHDEASDRICRGLLMRVFRILSTDYDFSLSKELRKEMNWLLYEEITGYIRANLPDITIQQLCRRFHFQEDYYNRLLKQKTGMTYTEYIQNLRLEEAERLLRQTDYSIEQIANLVGYQNKGYFYRIFTRRYQMTPARFRKMQVHP